MEGNWSEFGLAGMVIGALFVCLYFVFQANLTSRKVEISMFVDTVKDEANAHRQERAEWYAAHHASQAETREALKELTAAIKERKI